MTSEYETTLQWKVTMKTETIAAEVTDSQCRGGVLSNAAGQRFYRFHNNPDSIVKFYH